MAIKLLTKGEALPKKGKKTLIVYIDRLNDFIKELNKTIDGIGDTESLTPVQINNLITQKISGVGEDALEIDGLFIKDNGFTQYRKPIIKITDTATPATYDLANSESNTLILLDRFNGTNLRLNPFSADTTLGARFEFLCTEDITVNTTILRTLTGAGSIIGHVVYVDTGNSNAQTIVRASGNQINLNGGNTGGLIGSHIEMTVVENNKFYVKGTLFGNGAVGSIFTTQ